MAGETRYWRCPKCLGVHFTNDGSPWICYCATTDRGPLLSSTPEAVVVLPAAEYAAFQRLREAVEADEVFPKPHKHDGHDFFPRGCSYCEGWVDAIDADRAALKRRMEEP